MGGLSTPLEEPLPSPWDPLGLLMPRVSDRPSERSAASPSRSPGPARKAIEKALARARLAADGGPYATIDALGARDAGDREGELPLLGVPVAVKDLIAVRGVPARAGSRVRRDVKPESADAPVVAMLRRAGAVVVGTTALHEFGLGVTGVNEHEGTPLNPHDENRIPGGSSSGSAVAVADGSARLALGTDTGGSVRIPAALCGVVGFKPAFGTYCTEGVFPLAPSMDHVGLLAPSVAEIRDAHAVLDGPVTVQAGVGRLGFSPSELDQCCQEVRRALNEALRCLRAAGWEIVPLEWPSAEEVAATSTTLLFAEAAAVHKRTMLAGTDGYGQDVSARLHLGMTIPADRYVVARRYREARTERVQEQLVRVDAMVGPTVPIVAPALARAGDPSTTAALVANTRLANVTGVPAASLPIPREGLPVGLQVIATTNERTLAVAADIEGQLAKPR